MSNYPSAKQAKQIAFEAKEQLFQKRREEFLEMIFSQIRHYANLGYTSVSITKDADVSNFTQLGIRDVMVELGYEVKTTPTQFIPKPSTINPSSYTISWE